MSLRCMNTWLAPYQSCEAYWSAGRLNSLLRFHDMFASTSKPQSRVSATTKLPDSSKPVLRTLPLFVHIVLYPVLVGIEMVWSRSLVSFRYQFMLKLRRLRMKPMSRPTLNWSVVSQRSLVFRGPLPVSYV